MTVREDLKKSQTSTADEKDEACRASFTAFLWKKKSLRKAALIQIGICSYSRRKERKGEDS